MKQYACIIGLSLTFLATPTMQADESYNWSPEMKVLDKRLWCGITGFLWLTLQNEHGAKIDCIEITKSGERFWEVPDATKPFGVRQGRVPVEFTLIYPVETKSAVADQELKTTSK